MANEIKAKIGTNQTLTITLASLASSTTGVGRQSTIVDNTTNLYQTIHIYCKVTVGTTPTAGKNIYVYFLRSNGTLRTDGAGASDAAHTRVNARLLGPIAVPAATSDTAYYGEFVVRNPGKEWGITIVQDTGVALNATAGNHSIAWNGENPEIQ